jgi:hypothetical protein
MARDYRRKIRKVYFLYYRLPVAEPVELMEMRGGEGGGKKWSERKGESDARAYLPIMME